MGGKGSSPPKSEAPPVMEPQQDMSAVIGPMMEMMMMTANSKTPTYTPPPASESVSNINWEEKQKELNDKIKADVSDELRRKKGRASTVLTNPLEEEPVKTVQAKASGV